MRHYLRSKGGYADGEVCKCGHLKSEHGSRTTEIDGQKMYRGANDGGCCEEGCCCKRFRFAGWAVLVTAEP